MLNCIKNWQPISHNKKNYNISGGLLYVSSGLVFSAAPAQNILLQKPTAGFFPNSFPKKSAISGMATHAKTMVLWAHTRDQNCFQGPQKQFSCPTRKGQSGPGSNQRHCNQLPAIPARTKHKEKKSKHLPHKQCRIPKLGKHASARTHQSPRSVSPKEDTPKNKVQSQKTGLNSGGSAPRQLQWQRHR